MSNIYTAFGVGILLFIKKALSHHLVDFLRKNSVKYYASHSVTDHWGYAPSCGVCLSCVFLVKCDKSTMLSDTAKEN